MVTISKRKRDQYQYQYAHTHEKGVHLNTVQVQYEVIAEERKLEAKSPLYAPVANSVSKYHLKILTWSRSSL
jgi:hypothetical protein